MIDLTKLNGTRFTINAELIETLEGAKGHTVVNLASNNRYLVRETVSDVTEKVIVYRKKVNTERKTVNPIQGYERT